MTTDTSERGLKRLLHAYTDTDVAADSFRWANARPQKPASTRRAFGPTIGLAEATWH